MHGLLVDAEAAYDSRHVMNNIRKQTNYCYTYRPDNHTDGQTPGFMDR